MFAIVDIETCGGRFKYEKSRIIEICILIHDGLSVVDKFVSLLNPECYIAPMFTNISGITNEMVMDAPKFFEVAKQIDEITQNCVFVAHNVKFDYTFVREEFSSLGFTYKRETFCTVQLSRKLIPGKMSYSLGNLCDRLGIVIEERHRAEGDAQATAKLFTLLLQMKSSNPAFKNKGVTQLNTHRVDNIKKYVLDKLPESCGVYYFLDKDKSILYIGKSRNMYNRAIQHFGNNTKKAKKMLFELMDIDFVQTGSELIALLRESIEIKLHKPTYNKVRKSDSFTQHLVWFKDSKGIINFNIVNNDEHNYHNLISFTTYSAASETLDRLVEQYELCLKHTTQPNEEFGNCFNYQIKKCRGICNHLEEVEQYNLRALELINAYNFAHANFIIFGPGRRHDEHSFVMIENSLFVGFGYFDTTDSIVNPQHLKEYFTSKTHYPDAEILIRMWMKLNVGKYKWQKF